MGELLAMRREDRAAAGSERWVRTQAVADHFGVSPATVRRWVGDGMPSVKQRRARLFRVSQCDRWLRAQQERTG